MSLNVSLPSAKQNLLKVGVIGTGKMGQYHCNLLSQWKKERKDGIEFVGLHDRNQQLGLKLAEQYQTSFFQDIAKLLVKVDAVIVAASTASHFSLAKLVLAQKKHLLIEKPLTENLQQAKELFALAKKYKLILQVGHVERYNATVLALKNLKDLKNHYRFPLLWESRRMSMPVKRNINSGVCTDLLTHDIDLFFQFCGKHLLTIAEVDISAIGRKVVSDFEDIAIAQIKIPTSNPQSANFILGHFVASRVHHQQERTLVLTQEKNTLALDLNSQELQLFSPEQQAPQQIEIKKNNALLLEITDFLNRIQGNVENDGKIDLLVLETVLEIKNRLNL